MYTELKSGYLQYTRKKALRLLSIKQKQIISEVQLLRRQWPMQFEVMTARIQIKTVGL